MIAAVRSEVSVNEPVLYVACELAKKQWKLAMTSGFGVAAIVRTVTSGDWEAIEGAMAGARRRFGLPAATAVVSCYEAGVTASGFIGRWSRARSRTGWWTRRASTSSDGTDG